MSLTPKQIAELLAKAAEYMALAEQPGVTESERVWLRLMADKLFSQCDQAAFVGRTPTPAADKSRLH